MELPKINLKEFEEKKEKNRQERIEFIDLYTDWLRKTPNEVWSKHHANFINSGIAIANTGLLKNRQKTKKS